MSVFNNDIEIYSDDSDEENSDDSDDSNEENSDRKIRTKKIICINLREKQEKYDKIIFSKK